MLSRPLVEAIAGLRAEFPHESLLMAELPANAVFARATGGELDESIARLLELTAMDELGDRAAFEAFDLLAAADWQKWDMPAVQAIAAWADAWWLTVLADYPGEQRAIDRLAELSHLGLTMVRWLQVWLTQLDGPAAEHLADFILNGSTHPAWQFHEDQLGQAVAWTQSDKVVTGVTMIAGSHLAPGQMAGIIDRIVVTPGLH